MAACTNYLSLRPIIPAKDGVTIAEFEQVSPTILQILEETGVGPCWFLTAAKLDCPTVPVEIPTIQLLCSNPKNCRLKLEAIDTLLRIVVVMGGPVFRTLDPDNICYSQRVPMGGSIGVKGAHSSGTLGGYIFEDNKKNVWPHQRPRRGDGFGREDVGNACSCHGKGTSGDRSKFGRRLHTADKG